MATLISSWGASDATVYVEVADVTSYVAGYILGDTTSWTAATTSQQETAILRATRDLDNAYSYVGMKKDFNQSLQFPRQLPMHEYPFSRIDPDVQDLDDFEREMKDRVRKACAEQAFHLLKNAGTEQTHLQRQADGIRSFSESIGPLSESVSYRGSGGGFMRLSPDSYAYIKYYRSSPKIERGSAFDTLWR